MSSIMKSCLFAFVMLGCFLGSTQLAKAQKILISPGHGYYNHNGQWKFQRAHYWGVVEDLLTAEFAILLRTKLLSRGYAVYTARNLDKSAGNGVSGFPKWQESARTHMEAAGFPSSIWNVSGFAYRDQDIICRPNYANYLAADLLISLHTNGAGGTGTETYYDSTSGKPAESEAIASLVHNKVIAKIRSDYSSSWTNRGLKNSSGAFGEIRRANVPAFLIEVAFHDRESDNIALKNATFRNAVTTAIADGVDEFFANSGGPPDLTISQNVVVSKSTAAPGETIRVDWTEKNNGIRASALPHNTRLYLSTSAYGATIPIGTYSSNTPLAAGASAARFDDAVVIPPDVPPGQYYVTAFIDYDMRIAEANENNNIGSTSPNKITISSPPDTSPPTFSAIAVSPVNLIQGGATTVSYTVSDAGGAGLAYGQLWRTTDSGGAPHPDAWMQIGANVSLSGNGPVSGSFSDAPAAGAYWYRVHATDHAGNSGNQQTNGGFPPRKVVVATPTRIVGLSGSMAFGEVLVGSSAAAVLTISNAGNSALAVTAIAYPDGFSGDWSVGTIAAGGVRKVNVTFSPISAISYSGTIVVNSDSTSGTNTIVSSGTGITRLQAWRKFHFGSTANAGGGADGNDFDGDGIANLLEFAFGLDPKADSSGLLPVPQRIGSDFVVTFYQPGGVGGIAYGAEWSETLDPGDWTEISNSTAPPLRTYRVPLDAQPQLFMRLKVTSE